MGIESKTQRGKERRMKKWKKGINEKEGKKKQRKERSWNEKEEKRQK